MNPFLLSYKVLRKGTGSFQHATMPEVAKSLNRIGHFCLNVFATTALIIALMIFIESKLLTTSQIEQCAPNCVAVLYAFAMWMQLATVRYRNVVPLVLTVAIELVILGLVMATKIPSVAIFQIREVMFYVLFVFITIVRLVYMLILYKVLQFKNPRFTLATTVFLKPTNTPVTFSSVLAPQELDPTNPYYPQTVYNSNQVKSNLLDKSLT
ncbi:hypothetical protein CRE_26535 [Caenorhabditis remanei]|uniref:Uncharacterized protein n=2 Tax=Caenorhabditis remanei TaxID=31234 RepID=E3LR40_CAERE|nr:hypothetical protein CRE_26535 [Caenorhabditis remanei]